MTNHMMTTIMTNSMTNTMTNHTRCVWCMVPYTTRGRVPKRSSVPYISYMLCMVRPTQAIIYVPLLVNRFQKSILLIVQYKDLKSCSGDCILQNLILRTRSCGTGSVTRSSWGFHSRQIYMIGRKCFVPQFYQFRRGIAGGPALKIFLHDS